MMEKNKIILEKIVVGSIFAAGIAAGASYWIDSCNKMPACIVDNLPAGYIKACAVDTNNDGKRDTILEQQFIDRNGDGKPDFIQSCEYEMDAYTLRKCGTDWDADGTIDQITYPVGAGQEGTLL